MKRKVSPKIEALVDVARNQHEFFWMDLAVKRDGAVWACLFVGVTPKDRYQAGKEYMKSMGYEWANNTLEEELALPDYQNEWSI